MTRSMLLSQTSSRPSALDPIDLGKKGRYIDNLEGVCTTRSFTFRPTVLVIDFAIMRLFLFFCLSAKNF
jgi:hypothetical protein